MQHGPWLKDFLVFLVAAGLIVPLFHRARIGAVLGFLLIGVAVGPFGLGQLVGDYPFIRYLTIEDRERVAPFAELGVMFLLFLIGLELSMARLWTLRRLMLGAGGLQFVLSAFLIAAMVALLGVDTAPAIVLGLCLAMSSTAIVMQLLEEQGRMATSLGQLALAILLFQDIMVAPVLFGTEMLGREGQSVLVGLGGALLQAAVAVAVIVSLGYFGLRPLFRIAGQTGSRELILAMALLIAVGAAAATGWFGLSAALGAFLGGLLLSETEYRHQIEIDLAPVKGLLLGLFFITVGMSIDVRAAWGQIGAILLAVAAIYVLKAAVIFAVCSLLRIAAPSAAEAALLLAQAGEFGFVVVTLGAANGVLPSPLAQFVTVVIGIGMVATPLIANLGRRLGTRLQHTKDGEHAPAFEAEGMTDHVVIGGFGRVGQTVAKLLEAENVPFIALDVGGNLVADQRKAGRTVFYGDAGRPEMIERVGGRHARAFVVTVNAARAAERMVTAARSVQAEARVFARAKDAGHARKLLQIGAAEVTLEAVEASLQLGARLLEALGLPEEAVSHRIAAARKAELGQVDPPKT